MGKKMIYVGCSVYMLMVVALAQATGTSLMRRPELTVWIPAVPVSTGRTMGCP